MTRISKLIILLIICLSSFKSLATHIVGGEIEVQRLEINNPSYQFKLILYFDKVNGNPDARDETITLGVYRRSDRALVRSITIPLGTIESVSYTNPDPACNNDAVQTDRLVYASTPQDLSGFTSPSGYFVMWDRCCRNDVIDNIVVPNTPMTFYTEFPAINIINSSPALFPPLRDYACANQPFYAVFTGDDPDGDSLVYSLSTPLAGFADATDPIPPLQNQLPTIPQVVFRGGHSLNNMIMGNPPLTIDQNGILTVAPANQGLYVFGVRCEEFRNGVKIGEVRRDYQLFVIPDCDRDPPVLTFDNNPPDINSTTLTYFAGDRDTCLVFTISDPNINTVLTVDIQPISHSNQNGITLNTITDLNIQPGEEARFEVCIPGCTNIVDEIYEFQVIVADNSCPQPLRDTSKIVLDVKSLPNNVPQDSIVTVGNPQISLGTDGCYEAEVIIGDTLKFTVDAFDIDGDSIWLFAQSASENLASLGIDFGIEKQDSAFQFNFEWIPTCENLGNGVDSKTISMELVVADIYGCGERSRDTICVNILLKQPPFINEIPDFDPITNSTIQQIGTNPVIYRDTIFVSKDNFDTYTFDVSILDLDGDSMLLEAIGNGFDLSSFGMTFPSAIANVNEGTTTTASSTFDWTPACTHLDQLDQAVFQQEFEIQFIATDYNDCFRESKDTVIVRLLLFFTPDENNEPDIILEEVAGNLELVNDIYCDTLTIGQGGDDFISFNLIGSDIDTSELVRLFAIPQGFDMAALGMNFQPRTKTLTNDTIIAPFTWNPDCNALGTDKSTQTYIIDFVVQDENTCEVNAADTIRVKLVVQDIEIPEPEPFPNAFSPNGDAVNQTFTNPTSAPWLPGDNCADIFVGIEIYNRLGKKVFTSQEKNFAWDGEGYPSGVYFYHIEYQNSDYKGTVHLFRGNGN